MNRFKAIKYTYLHRKAFRQVEKKLFGRVSLRGYLHDLDKIILYPFLGKKLTSKIHKNFSHHHLKKAKTYKDFKEMVIDWECARYTKSDKPLNAYNTLYKYYPQLTNTILPILKELNLICNTEKENYV